MIIKKDKIAIENLIKREQQMVTIEDYVFEVENSFLERLTIKDIRKYKKINSDDWLFLTIKEKNIIYNTKKLYKKMNLLYRLELAELMIQRKNNNNLDYTYEESLFNLGFYKDGYLKKYILDENLKYK